MSIEIDFISGNCPVQAEGTIDGEPFYFRARDSHWSLSVGSKIGLPDKEGGVHGLDVIGEPIWYYEEQWGDTPFAAGWMPYEEARKMLDRGAALYREAARTAC